MEIKFWENESGRTPVLDFIGRQPSEASARIMKSLDYFDKQGMNLLASPGRMKSLTAHRNLYELKVDFKGIFYRFIFCVAKGVAHLLVAFKKKDNHTRRNHIKTALNRQQSLAA